MNEETTSILIDTALASGSASALDPEERKLQELVLAIRDDAPTPDPDFALRMDARVAAGFPKRRAGASGAARAGGSAKPNRIRTLLTTRPQLAPLGAAASLLIALVVAISIGNSGGGSSLESGSSGTASSSATPGTGALQDKTSGRGGAAATDEAAPTTQRAPAAPAAKAVAPAGSSNGVAAVTGTVPVPPTNGFVGGSSRKVERSAALVLAPAHDKLSEVGDGVVAVTDRYRGIVMRSTVTDANDTSASGSFDLRIPVRNLRPALRDLSALADVQSRTENADDVTAPFVSARTRLQELTAEHRSLVKRLANAKTDQESSQIRQRIRFINEEIQVQATEIKALQRRTSYATVSVTLQPKQKGSGGGGTGIGDGARDLRDSLVDAANIALRVLGVALPIAILIALLWGGSGWFNRRRREAVLD